MSRRRKREVVQVIYWRDIPAQITAVSGGENHKALLTARFQHAIDRAAHNADLTDHKAYIAEWRKEEQSVEADPAAQVEALAAQFESDYPRERLEALVAAGGADETVNSAAAAGSQPAGESA